MPQKHPEIVKRLRRADGHLQRIVEMLADGRSCLEVAQQLHAVEKAIGNAKRAFIHDHIDSCLSGSIGRKQSARSAHLIDEFRELGKYL